MLEEDIEALQKELNHLVGTECDYSKIYEVSVQLDKLIVEYYKNNYKRIEFS